MFRRRPRASTGGLRTAVGIALVGILSLTACSGGGGSDSGEQESTSRSIVRKSAPEFALPSASGGRISLSDFTGRPVLLYFSMGPG
ncbi:MAG: redoxin domain-containing protein [Actinobacteria bacterium]|nr:redoxin domain-containing protein [Actinomycetota bacterium]